MCVCVALGIIKGPLALVFKNALDHQGPGGAVANEDLLWDTCKHTFSTGYLLFSLFWWLMWGEHRSHASFFALEPLPLPF